MVIRTSSMLDVFVYDEMGIVGWVIK